MGCSDSGRRAGLTAESHKRDIKYASGVLAAARFPLARLRSAGGFNLQRRYETHAEDENVNLAHSSHD